MPYQQHSVNSSTLLEAWLDAFRALLEPGVREIVPLTVTIADEHAAKADEGARREFERVLDAALLQRHCYSVNTTANTIFPQSLWNPGVDRSGLYERYLRILPRIKKINHANVYGLYFERMISYQTREAMQRGQEPFNQLEHILTTYEGGNHRRSALHVAIFNPLDDHTDQRQRGFPCLQHVFFTPDPNGQELAVTGVYATQYLFARGYGNYLGLFRLGSFVGHELGLRLTQVTVLTNRAKLKEIAKREGEELARNLEAILR